MARKIKGVVFDLDDTLVDFWNFKNKCVNAAVDAMINAGLKIKEKQAKNMIFWMNKNAGMEYKYLFQKFLKKVNGKVDYRILAHALITYRKTRSGLLVSYPGVKSTLKKLRRKYKIAIISNAPTLKAWFRIVSVDIDGLFDVVLTSGDTKKRKPHKLPFKKVLEKLKMEPEEVLMVGDSVSRDMVGAKSVGMKTALALYGRTVMPKRKPKEADYMIKKISDLLKILK